MVGSHPQLVPGGLSFLKVSKSLQVLLIILFSLVFDLRNLLILRLNLRLNLRYLLINLILAELCSIEVADLCQESSRINHFKIGSNASQIVIFCDSHTLLVSFEKNNFRENVL